MASIQFDVTKVRQAIARDVGRRVMPRVMSQAIERSRHKLIDLLIRSWHSTLVGKGLRGLYHGDEYKDVPAHLGLTSADQDRAASEIESVLKQALQISRIVGRNQGFASLGNAISVGFNISLENLEILLRANVDGSYVSEQSGEVVPWLDWLLDGGGTPGFRITFNVFGQFTDLSGYSRSGRALMFKTNHLDWDTDDYNNFSTSGKNFIEDMVSNPAWYEKAPVVILKEAQRILNE